MKDSAQNLAGIQMKSMLLVILHLDNNARNGMRCFVGFNAVRSHQDYIDGGVRCRQKLPHQAVL